MESFIVAGVRTPIGRYGSALSKARPDDLAALVVGEAVRRAGVDPATIDEVVRRCRPGHRHAARARVTREMMTP
jgi:acetyl-CoA acetyltransferase